MVTGGVAWWLGVWHGGWGGAGVWPVSCHMRRAMRGIFAKCYPTFLAQLHMLHITHCIRLASCASYALLLYAMVPPHVWDHCSFCQVASNVM